jgi:hypothetical protein
MRTILAFAGSAVMFCCVSLVEGQGQNKGTADSHKSTGKTPPPAKKDSLPPALNKGSAIFHAKEHTGIVQAKKPTAPPKDIHAYSQQLKNSVNSGNLNLTPAQSSALNKLTSQQPLSPDDRQQLSNLLFNGDKAGLSSADETALSYLLTDDMARNDTTTAPSPAENSQGPMYLRVLNKTTEPIKVWVQVVAKDAAIVKSDKSAQPEVLRYDLQAGKAYDLHNKGDRLAATAIRIWAMSPTRQWASNRDHDLPLTSASTSKVFTVTFAPTATAQAGSEAKTAVVANR